MQSPIVNHEFFVLVKMTSAGPYLPGCMDVMTEYSENGLFMRLYYPTDAKRNDVENCKSWPPWIPDDSYLVGIAKVLMCFTFLIRLVFWCSSNIRIPILYGSKPATKNNKTDKLKCIVLSHGLGGCRFLYSQICCELASRGFLVAALEHRDGSACNTYYYRCREDARRDRRTLIGHRRILLDREHAKARNGQVHHRAEECSRALDFLIEVNEGTNVPFNVAQDVPPIVHGSGEVEFTLKDLVGNLDVETVTMAGHSFGGATALLALSKRDEFKQGILLDPWMFPIKDEQLDKHVKQPLLFVNTQTFHIASNVNAMSKYLDSDSRTMFTIRHTTHENQTDSVLLIGYWLNWFMKKLDPKQALRINNSLLLKFLKETTGVPESVTDCTEFLQGEIENYEEGLTRPWV